ncbi:unnamed protein product, partial [Mesorhabditis spiculigera]
MLIPVNIRDKKTGKRRNITIEIAEAATTAQLADLGKLRLYCNQCGTDEILLKREPSGWADVLKNNRIPVSCECCVDAAALSQTRGNWESAECVVCGDAPQFVFDFGCNHPCCKDCFATYSATQLREAQFRFRAPFGYTVACPSSGCDFCITDVHHFRVLGTKLYHDYQKLATEKLIALDNSGYFCPYPKCGASFFLEDDDLFEPPTVSTYARIRCVECRGFFCRNCREIECTCHNEELTKTTINLTTKKCPGCQVSTEKNGGCSHMSCGNCHLDWCWICGTAWKEDCQWDHWFG